MGLLDDVIANGRALFLVEPLSESGHALLAAGAIANGGVPALEIIQIRGAAQVWNQQSGNSVESMTAHADVLVEAKTFPDAVGVTGLRGWVEGHAMVNASFSEK